MKPLITFIVLPFILHIAACKVVSAIEGQSYTDSVFFNGKDLSGWSAPDMKYWSTREGAIIGHYPRNLEKNEFLWSDVEVKDFYLCVDVLLDPDDCNAGIQFRSNKADGSGQATGYQADVGKGVWGRLYHEHGRGQLDWTDRGEKAVHPGEWNRYEILAVEHRIWMAINGTLSVAVEDPGGELNGFIAFQIHAGKPQTVKYRIIKLVHNPEVELAGFNEVQLVKHLKAPLDSPSTHE